MRHALGHDWLAAEVAVGLSPAAPLWQHPIETASQSEGGFERTYQGTAVVPRFRARVSASAPLDVTVSLTLNEL